MIDTITIVAYLLGHHFGHNSKLQLAARFFEKENKTLCEPSTISPNLRWRDVPPEASSLAIIIKDANPPKKDEKTHYYWVVYNLPIHTMQLPFGASNFMRRHDEGLNSWGEQNYHSRCFDHRQHPVIIELVALDTGVSPDRPMTGEILEKKIVSGSHVLAKVEYSELSGRYTLAH